MRYEDNLPKLKVKKKESSSNPNTPKMSPLIDQMCTATVASLRGTMRGLREGDTSALAQAARNGHIVEELFFQENQSISDQSIERELLNLSKSLSEAANLAVLVNCGQDVQMKHILGQLLPYIESILEDITPSPVRRFMPAATPPSRKKLPSMKDGTVEAMAKSSDPEAIKSGIALFRLIEIVEWTIPVAIKIGATLSIERNSVQ